MPRERDGRPPELLPRGRLLEAEDSCTPIAEDQPEALVTAVRDSVAETSGRGA